MIKPRNRDLSGSIACEVTVKYKPHEELPNGPYATGNVPACTAYIAQDTNIGGLVNAVMTNLQRQAKKNSETCSQNTRGHSEIEHTYTLSEMLIKGGVVSDYNDFCSRQLKDGDTVQMDVVGHIKQKMKKMCSIL